MGKFNYKYKTIQNLKRILEKQAQKEVAEIELEIEREVDKLSKLRIEKARFIEKKNEPKRTKIVEMQFHENYIQQIEEKINDVENEIYQLTIKRDEKLKELEEKVKEKKIFEILEEKHLQEFIKEENRLEQLEIDEIATERFIRKDD